MTASLMKLTAGQGYTYLTRQVAVHDETNRAHVALADYYSEKGERPGEWVGSGLVGLDGIEVGDVVREDQMRNLFGLGIHPDADLIEQQLRAEWETKTHWPGQIDNEVTKAIKLGGKFPDYDTEGTMVEALRDAYQDWNKSQGLPVRSPVPAEKRAEIRSRIGTELFTKKHGRAPLNDRELTGFVTRALRPKNYGVAGFDLTFSPVKSVSALWAVAPREVAETIQRCHDQAVRDALKLAETEYAYTRRGAKGVRHEDINGLIATAFTHRDSRAGDPDLHTHVAVSNKVQSAVDGKWLALDGATLYRGMVDISERYNSALEAHLNRELGLTFAPFEDMRAKRDPLVEHKGREVREIVGVPEELCVAWSSRTTNIDARALELAEKFKEDHGRNPTPKERRELRQQANLETREAKHEPRSEAEQRATWRAQAEQLLGPDAAGKILSEVQAKRLRRTHRLSPMAERRIARKVIERVETDRARWRSTHVSAEVRRQLRSRNLHPDRAEDATQRVLDRILKHRDVLRVSHTDPFTVPAALTDRNGLSAYVNPHSALFTSRAVLDAEQRLVAAAQVRDRRALTSEQVDLALTESLANGVELNPGQATLVREMATSGARVQLALAPAGSGKTTSMRVLSNAWTDNGGTVIGLGPSATAASELWQAIGSESDTIANLTYRLQEEMTLPKWAQRINSKTLVIVDEAGMASTHDLAVVVDFVTARGGQVRLVGDDQQLASIAAGGVLRDIQTTAGAVSLSELMRFRDPAEASATLAVRDGDVEALGWYLDNKRVHADPEGASLDALYEAWQADRAQGVTSLMMAYRIEDVTALNARARADRLAALPPDHPHKTGLQVTLRTGLQASAGDLIITRRNDRNNKISATDWVKNGDRWSVTGVRKDGSLDVKHQGSGRRAMLPPDYVRDHVDLGYACTIHTSQGTTVDVSRTYLRGDETRQLAYVAMSRGREANHVYIGTGTDADPHQAISPDQTNPVTPTEILEGVLRRDGSQKSATTELRLADDPAVLLGRYAGMHKDAVLATAEHYARENDPEWEKRISEQAEEVVAGITDQPAWDTLRGQLAILQLEGRDPIVALRSARDSRELDTAQDTAAVLWWRITDHHRNPGGEGDGSVASSGGPLPWLQPIPQVLRDDDTFGPFLTQLDTQVRATRDQLAERIRDADEADMPAWAVPLFGHRELVAEIAVWRAAHQIPDDDAPLLGTVRVPYEDRKHERRLQRRIDTILGKAGARWAEQVGAHTPGVLTDPYWPVLGRRLDAAAEAVDVPAILERALAKGALPDDHPAAALWYRLVPDLAPAAALAGAAASKLRPDWMSDLTGLVGEERARTITASPAWTSLVAVVHKVSTDTHATPAELLDTAVALTDLDTTPDEALAQILAYRVADTTHPHTAPTGGVDTDALPVDALDLETAPTRDELAAYLAGDLLDTNITHTNPLTDAGIGIDAGVEALVADGVPVEFDELPPDPDTEWTPTASDLAALYTARQQVTPDAHTLAQPHHLPRTPDPEPEWGPTSSERIVELHQQAAAFYRQQYDGSTAAGWVASRFHGDDLTAHEHLVIGYAPGRGALTAHLRELGATDQELVDAGLARHSRTGKVIDVFNDRVVIGLHDAEGQLVGFSGRCAPGTEDTAPKYLNTPATRAFHKGEILFGITENPDAATNRPFVVRAEGVFDAIAVSLAGDGHALGVAPCGTAFTAAQADLIAGLKPRGVIEAVDNDRAGIKAIEKDHTLFTQAGLNIVRRLDLTTAGVKDPSELYQRDPATLATALQNTPGKAPTLQATLVANLIDQHTDRIRENALAANAIAERAGTILATLPDRLWQDHITAAAIQLADARQDPDSGGWWTIVLTEHTLTCAETWNATPATPTAPTATSASTTNAQDTGRALDRIAATNANTRAALARAQAILDGNHPTPSPETKPLSQREHTAQQDRSRRGPRR